MARQTGPRSATLRFLLYGLICGLCVAASALAGLSLMGISGHCGGLWLVLMPLVTAPMGYFAGRYKDQNTAFRLEAQRSSAQLDYLIRALEGRVARRTDALRQRTEVLRIRSDSLKEAHAAAEEARLDAQAASRAKSQFLANMSHEVRTPLNGVLGLTELLLQEEIGERQRDYLGTIHQSATSLLTVLNDILDLSKVEAGKLSLERIDFQLRALVFGVARVHAPAAYAQGNEILCDFDDGLPDRFYGDPTRLRQVLTNLISNANKFTAHGEILIRVTAQTLDDDRVQLEFSVSDDGAGIPEDQQEGVFRAFAQADGTTTRRFGGTGLGLAISSQLVALMGGELSLDSQPNQGSTFTFGLCLTQCRSPSAESPAIGDRRLKGLEILIVDRNATCCSLLAKECERWGMRPYTASDGRKALQLLAGEPERFSLVLADGNLGDMDSVELAERLREREIKTPVVLMTLGPRHPGLAAEQGRQDFDAFLLKPVRPADLLSAVLALLQHEPVGGAARLDRLTPLSAKAVEGGPCVLLVEDNRVNRMVAEHLLVGRGCHVRTACDGQVAVDAFLLHRFDLVLMDIQMPIMDGYEAARQMRLFEQEGGRRRTPIVAFTAHAMKDERDRCLAAGMDDHMTKPVQVAELDLLLDKVKVGGLAKQSGCSTGA